MSEDLGRDGAPRRWLRRLALSVLAGGGVTAAGLSGVVSGGAVAAEPHLTPPGAGVGSTSPASVSTTSSSTSSAEGSSSTSTSSSASASETRTSTTHSGGSAAPRPSRPQPPKRPTVNIQRPQPRPKRGSRKGASTRSPKHGSKGGGASAGKPANVPSNVAAPPQMVASHANLLSALTKGLSVSTQALDLFYQVPPFLLPIYQAAAVQYGVPWEVLAAINEVETDYGNDLSVSSAGAVGWMQFMPATWLQYGVDALDAGYADPYNPVDAIFAAARYLAAAGASKSLRTAIFAYNHSEAYVESVMLRARLLASYPPSAIATLTGLIEGVSPLQRSHVVAASLHANAFAPAPAPVAKTPASSVTPTPSAVAARARTTTTGSAAAHTAGKLSLPAPDQFVELEGVTHEPVVASQSGRVLALGHTSRLGNYIAIEDVYGDVFTYAGLGSIASRYRTSQGATGTPTSAAIAAQTAGAAAPHLAASAGSQSPVTLAAKPSAQSAPDAAPAEEEGGASEVASAEPSGKVLLYARPGNPDARAVAAQLKLDDESRDGWAPLRVGAVVSQGTILGAPSTTGGSKPATSLRFAVRPAGDTSAVNPVPILQNWDQLQRALHPQGAKAGAGLVGATASGVFLLSQSELERQVLADPAIVLPTCARHEVSAGRINARVLAMLLFLSRSGLKPTVSEVRCGGQLHGSRALYSAIEKGEGVDISKINDVPIAEHQGAGSITDLTIRTLLTLQGRFAPHRIVSLMRYPGSDTTYAAADHSSYIEVDFPPEAGAAPSASVAAHSAGPGATAPSPLAVSLGLGSDSVGLSAAQWNRLVERIASLPQPHVATKPTSAAIKDPPSTAAAASKASKQSGR